MYIFLLSIFGISFFFSCKKEDTNNSENTEAIIEVQKNDAEATRIYNLITDEINDISATLDTLNYSVNAKTLSSCVTVTINYPDTTTWPKTIILDFSNS